MSSSAQEKRQGLEQQKVAFQTLFEGLPADPNRRLDALAEVNHAFRRALADELRPVVRELIQHSPPADGQHRKELARHLNHILHDAGLAIVDPGSGYPASVVADPYRLKLQSRTNSSGRRPCSGNTKSLPPLELMECPRREPFLTWRDRTKLGRPDEKTR